MRMKDFVINIGNIEKGIKKVFSEGIIEPKKQKGEAVWKD